MTAYGYLSATEDRNMYHHQHFGILGYSVTHMLGRVELVEEAEYGLEDLDNGRLGELVDSLVDGDVLIVSDIHRLGQSTTEIIGMFVEILKRGATVCAFDGQYDLGSNAMFRWLPSVLSVLLLAKKELELSRSKEPANRKHADGAVVLGRPVGRLGVSRLDGREEIILNLLNEKIPKAEIARQMDVSRPALHDFIVSRKLLPKSQ